MNTKIKVALILTTGMYFFTACNNDRTTNKGNTDTTATTAINNDTAGKKTNMDDTSKTDNALMSAMNTMMGKMDTMQMSGNFDIDYASMMIEHHHGAVDMAKIEVAKGAVQKIELMAQKMITEQTEEQGKLSNIIKSYKSGQPKSDSTHAEHQLHDIMINMMDKVKGMQMTGNTDKDFVMMMIPHHESAIEMAKTELSHGKNIQLKQMAQKDITSQTKEISEFKSWLESKK